MRTLACDLTVSRCSYDTQTAAAMNTREPGCARLSRGHRLGTLVPRPSFPVVSKAHTKYDILGNQSTALSTLGVLEYPACEMSVDTHDRSKTGAFACSYNMHAHGRGGGGPHLPRGGAPCA